MIKNFPIVQSPKVHESKAKSIAKSTIISMIESTNMFVVISIIVSFTKSSPVITLFTISDHDVSAARAEAVATFSVTNPGNSVLGIFQCHF